MNAHLGWLGDPRVFAVNRLPPVSDHVAYRDEAAARRGGAGCFRQSLNGRWRFALAQRLDGIPEGFHEAGFDASGWAGIDVPGHMQLQGFGRPHYVNVQYPWDGVEALRPPQLPRDNLVGCHIRDFDLPEGGAEDRVTLVFDGADAALHVWVNGALIGYAEDSFTPSRFDVTAHVRPGRNRLAVQVTQRCSGSWLEGQDFWRLSGLFRDVWLERRPALRLDDLFVQTALSDDFAEAELRLALRLAVPAAGGRVEAVLRSPAGEAVAEASAAAAPETALRLPVRAPALWSAETPTLYRLMILLRDAQGAVAEAIPEEVGFRRFEIVDGVMRLNGERIVFNGVNRHEFCPRRGRAITAEQMLWDARFLKRCNVNAVRASHYPNQSLWYRLCDRLGLYVIDETNLETHGSWQKGMAIRPDWVIPDDRPEWRDAVLDRAASMLERDKNRPSVLFWSCGNESFGGKTLFEMSEYFRRRDPSRLVHYEGVYNDRRFDGASDVESRMYAKPQEVEAYLQSAPKKPFLLCEYMHSMGNSCGGMQLYTELAERYKQYQGGFIWDYIDQALEIDTPAGPRLAYGGDFDDRPTDGAFCANGVVTARRAAKPAMQAIKALYQPVALIPDRDGVEIVNHAAFRSTAGYALRYALLRDGVELFAGETGADIAPGARGRVALDLPRIDADGDYALHCALTLTEATGWAEAGHEVAFGAHLWRRGEPPSAAADACGEAVHGEVNLGLRGTGWRAQCAHAAPGPTSFVADGVEWMRRPPRLVFWRALTDNDRGCGLGFDLAAWRAAQGGQRVVDAETGPASIRYRIALPGLDVEPTLNCRLGGDGALHVVADFPGAAGLPDLPLFGVEYTLPPAIDRLRYYGLGPEETQRDRLAGARLGVFETRAGDALAPYLRPQEAGNRMGVRWLEARDGAGRGLRIRAADAPVEAALSHWTAEDIEAADHREALPPIRKTVLRLAAAQMGVGGDDSWGAPVQDRFRLRADAPLRLAFSLAPLAVGNRI